MNDRPPERADPAARAPGTRAAGTPDPEAPHGPIPIRRALRGPGGPAGETAGETTGEAAGEGRSFEAGGEVWVARPAGESAVGHGAGARAYLVAVRFYRAGDQTPVSEILIPRGRFEALYDEELEELWRRATPLAAEPERPARPPRLAAEDEPPPEG